MSWYRLVCSNGLVMRVNRSDLRRIQVGNSWRAGAQREVAQSNRSAPPKRATEPPTDHAQTQREPPRMSWARLLKRVFDLDIQHCLNCGSALKIIAAPLTRCSGVEDPPVIIKILSHLGLPTRAPPRAPARRVDLFQTI